EKEVMIIYCGVNGYLDDVEIDKIQPFEAALYRFMDASHPEVGKAIAVEKAISPETESKLKAAIEGFKRTSTF
ncbi:MAG: F0F1 ATP synthase subunit alpha, partial [Chloroflexota bacterium]|nr:F0F1 ATP synthase subunit alpha [Chloroflexota bacterium]